MNREGLLNVLIANPGIEKVYFDKHGGWLFDPNVLHPVIKTREEVLEDLSTEIAQQNTPPDEKSVVGEQTESTEIAQQNTPPGNNRGGKKDK